VLDGLAGALGQVLQHRVRRVAEQGDPAAGPARQRLPVVHRPPSVPPQETGRLAYLGAAGPERLVELPRTAPLAVGEPRIGRVPAAAEHGDLVVDLPG